MAVVPQYGNEIGARLYISAPMRKILLVSLVASLAIPETARPIVSVGTENRLLVKIAAGKVTAPDSVQSGWTRIAMVTSGTNHAPALFRLPPGVTKRNLDAFATALDTSHATPTGALAMGGRIAGDNGEVIVDIEPGNYVLTCLTKNDSGHRHGIAGESKILVVTRAHSQVSGPPRATVAMKMTDFAYTGPERWPAGSYLVRVENVGRQDHQLRIARLPATVNFEQVVRSDNPRGLVKPVAGIGRMGPSVTYLPVRLTPGRYVLFCLVHDPGTGLTHNKLGMFRQISVQ